MDPAGFLADVERTPQSLRDLAGSIDAGRFEAETLALPSPADVRRILLLGMGSSAYAAAVVAARLRAAGLDAVAELASSDLLPPPDAQTLVIAVSASGESAETIEAVARYRDQSPVLVVTEQPGSTLAGAGIVLPLMAGPEIGGVACRSYRHTLAVLLALTSRFAPSLAEGLAVTVRYAADATEQLLESRRSWLPGVATALDGRDGSWVVAPARRLGSALQSALMLREGPRRSAHACETGDWSHVDVYLTKTLDYRMLLLPGSRYQPELLRWTAERHTTVVCLGAELPGAAAVVRYVHDDEDDVRLLAEVTVAELVAHRWWAAG